MTLGSPVLDQNEVFGDHGDLDLEMRQKKYTALLDVAKNILSKFRNDMSRRADVISVRS